MIRSDRAWASALFALALAVATPWRSAHHSFAPYEPDIQIQFTGTVTEFQWTNPHVYIEMDVSARTASPSIGSSRAPTPGY